MNRRMVLKGGAGIAVALPFLTSAQSRTAHAQLRDGGPRRLFVMSHGQGWVMGDSMPDASFQLPEVLRDLEPIKSKLLVLSGIDNRVGGGGHNPTQRSQFSAMPAYGANKYFENIFSSGPSIDQVVAKRIAAGGSLKTLNLASQQGRRDRLDPVDSPFFWHDDADAVTHMTDPRVAFTKVFGDDEGGVDPQPAIDRLQVRRRSVLDTVLGQFKALNARVSVEDRRRLEQHADKIRQLEKSMAETPGIRDLSNCRDRPQIADVSDPKAVVEVVNALVDIAVLGTACGVADVATMVLFEGSYDWLQNSLVDQEIASSEHRYHILFHKFSDSRDNGRPRQATNIVNKWHVSRFARFVAGLDAIDEGDGTTALDHTLAVMIPEFGNGRGHGSGNLPCLLAGNFGDVPMGRYLAFTDDLEGGRGTQTTNQLHVSILNAFGDPTDRFGDYSDDGIPRGPLTGL